MIKIYARDSEIQDGNGARITSEPVAVESAKMGTVTDDLRSALRQHGIRPALGETVLLIDGGETTALTV